MASNKSRYSQVETSAPTSSFETSTAQQDEEDEEEGEITPWDNDGPPPVPPPPPSGGPGRVLCRKQILWFGMACCVGFVIAAVIFGGHCAQVAANAIQGSVLWSPQLAGVIAMLGLMSQVLLMSLPFQYALQRPLLRRYENVDVRLAKILDRERVQSSGTNSNNATYKVVLVYMPNSDGIYYYAKKFQVTAEEYYHVTDYAILVLPEWPTSAILKTQYDKASSPCSKRNLMRVALSLVSIVMWILVVKYTYDMQQYATGDVWVHWGLWLLFGLSLVPSILFGYLLIAQENETMLYGQATALAAWQLPPGFSIEPSSSSGPPPPPTQEEDEDDEESDDDNDPVDDTAGEATEDNNVELV